MDEGADKSQTNRGAIPIDPNIILQNQKSNGYFLNRIEIGCNKSFHSMRFIEVGMELFLDWNYVYGSLGIWSDFVKKEKKVIYLPFLFLRLFLHLVSFLCPFCLRFFLYCQLLPACATSHQLIVESCASPFNNLISLDYSMPVFSANSFGLFNDWLHMTYHIMVKFSARN